MSSLIIINFYSLEKYFNIHFIIVYKLIIEVREISQS